MRIAKAPSHETVSDHEAGRQGRFALDGLLRAKWNDDRVLITDDLTMGAVYDLGVGRVAGEALERGKISLSRLQQSEQRRADFIPMAETRAEFRTNVKIAAPVSFRSPDAPADSRLAARKPAHAG